MAGIRNATASLEEIRKRSEEEKAVWQREREVMQQQANRLTLTCERRCWQQQMLMHRWRRSACSKPTCQQAAQCREDEDKTSDTRTRKEDALQQHVTEQRT